MSISMKDRDEIFKAINSVSNKVNEYSRRLDNFFGAITTKNTNDITNLCDYSTELLYKVCLLELGIDESDVQGGEENGL